jgi:hypothetical protein
MNLLSNFALYLGGRRTLRTLNANMRCTDCHSRCPTTATYILRCPTLSGSDGTTVCYPPVKYCHLWNAYGKARCETPQSGGRWQPASASYKLSTSSWFPGSSTSGCTTPTPRIDPCRLRIQLSITCVPSKDYGPVVLGTVLRTLNARYKHLVHRLSL